MNRFLIALLCSILISPIAQADWVPLLTANAGERGIFDPSFEWDPASGRLYMSHSIVEVDSKMSGKLKHAVSIGLSYSSNGGKTWKSLDSALSPATPARIENDHAYWQNEVSTLFRDPGAPAEKRWKILYHQYLQHKGKRRFEHGWIALREAPTPDGLLIAAPVKLFIGRGYKDVNDASDWTQSPLTQPGRVPVHDKFKKMDRCAALTEPGAYADDKNVYVSVVCPYFQFPGRLKPRIVLLKCAQPCNYEKPDSWTFVKTLLTHKQARAFDGNAFTGTELLPHPSGLHIIVSPEGNKPFRGAYQGCLIFSVESLLRGEEPVPKVDLRNKDNTFHGACDYIPAGPLKGLVSGRIDFSPMPQFKLFTTGVTW